MSATSDPTDITADLAAAAAALARYQSSEDEILTLVEGHIRRLQELAEGQAGT